MNRRLFAFVITIGAGASSCNLQKGSYAFDRFADLKEIGDVSVNLLQSGAVCNLGPSVIGLSVSHPEIGYERLEGSLGGIRVSHFEGVSAGLVAPLSRMDKSGARSMYDSRHPTFGSIGLDAGLFIGMGARFDFLEFADFVLGFLGVDLSNDDSWSPPSDHPLDDSDSESQPAPEESPNHDGYLPKLAVDVGVVVRNGGER